MKRNREKNWQIMKEWNLKVLILLSGLLLCGCGSNEETLPIVKMADLQEEMQQMEEGVQGQTAITEEATGFIIRIKDNLYIDTGDISTALRCGVMDGEITSTVESTEFPTENDQSNFGSGYGYQYGANDTIEVNMNDEWHIFGRLQPSSPMEEAIETNIHSITITHGTDGKTLEISRTIQSEAFWEIIEKYEALEVVKSENQTPTTGYTYWLRMYDEAGKELHSVSSYGEKVEIDNVRYEDYEKGTAAKLLLAVDALWQEDKPMGKLVLGTDRQKVESLEGVTMEVAYATPKGANLILSNNTEKEIHFGDDYILQAYVDGTWYEVDYIVDNWAFNAIGYFVPNAGTRSWSTRWNYFHGELSPGTYRIVKSIMDFRGSGDYTTYYLGAEFTIE